MTAPSDNAPAPEMEAGGDADSDLLTTAAKRWQAAWERERLNIEHAYADLRLRAGDDVEHWGPGVKAEREAEARPCFTVNRLPQYIEQVTGDQRQMRPSMRVVPVDSRADVDVADLIGGMFRYIEHRSSAAAVYNRAAESQVTCGVGAWRVVTEYAADSTFNQEIGIADIDDPVMVLWDPDATKLSRSDAQFCHVPVDLSRAAFKARYPDKTPADFKSEQNTFGFGSDWISDDHVRVTEYWYKVPEQKLLALMPNGSVDDLTDEADPNKLAQLKAAGARIEKRDAFCVWRAVLSCDEVLEEPTRWPGRYIPIVPVIGKEVRIGRRVTREGAIRHARDPQRIYNYATSAQVEVTALQPKAPFLVTEGMVENHKGQWEGANVENRPYLTFTPDPLAPGMKPERQQPPVASQGIQAILMQAGGDIEGTIGLYKSSVGAASNETSGKAILAREKQGDTSTYVYIQNLSEAIAHTARIVIDLIPHVYDTERELRIIGQDGTEELVRVNQPAGLAVDDQPEQVLNDLTVGAYDVVTDAGPSYATKREEAREGMQAFLQAMPQAGQFVADLVAKAQDWPNADQFAERLRMMMPPQIAQAEAAKNGEPPAPPPPPDPMQVAQMQHAQQQQQLEGMKHQVDAARLQLEQQKLQAEMYKVQAENARTARGAGQGSGDPNTDLQAAVQQAESQLAIERQSAELAVAKQALDVQKRELQLMAKALADKAQMQADTDAHHAKVAELQGAEAEATMPAVSGIAEMLAQMQAVNAGLVQAIGSLTEQHQAHGHAVDAIMRVAAAPTRIVRGPDGSIAGSEKII